MANYNVNYLQKGELIYEIMCRELDCQHEVLNKLSVDELRKSLRKIIGEAPNFSNIENKLTVLAEIKYCQIASSVLQVLIDRQSEEPTALNLAKINAKLAHLELRANMLKRSILLETDRKTVEELDKTRISLSNKLSEI